MMPNEKSSGRASCPLCAAPLRLGRIASGPVFECPGGHVYGVAPLLRQVSRTAARRLKALLDSLASVAGTSAELQRGAEEIGKLHLAQYLQRQADEARKLSSIAGDWLRDEATSEPR